MNDILDDFGEKPEITGTQWSYIFGFGFVYAFYIAIKLFISHFFIFEYISPKDILYTIFALLFLASHIFELCFCIVSLRAKYLSDSSKAAYFTCFSYSIMAFTPIIMIGNSYDDLYGFLNELFFTVLLVIVASTPFVIMASSLANRIAVYYNDEK